MVAIAPELQSPSTLESPAKPSLNTVSGPTEQRMIYCDRTWEQFKLIEQGLEGLNGLRLFYFDGKVEVLMLGEAHELFKKILAVLIEAFLFEHEIEFIATGSMTQRAEGLASGEPDESYRIGEFTLIVEIIFTSSSLDKLGLYQAVGIDEVWFWEDGVLAIHHLRGDRYEKVDRSEIPELRAIDLAELSRCILIGETSFLRARKEFLAAHPKQ